MRTVENIIIGGGPGGYELAIELASRGESTVLIEKDRLGGTCLNRGCIPTKCLCASASTLRRAESAGKMGIDVTVNGFDFIAIHKRAMSVVDGLRDGIRSMLSNVEVIEGRASLKENNVICVGDDMLQASRRIVIATGSVSSILPVPGASHAMLSEDFLNIEKLPASCVIIGGGVIGMEFASILSAFGVAVTVIEYCKEILPMFDSDMTKRLRQTLSRAGVTFKTGMAVAEIVKDDDSLWVAADGKKGRETFRAESVLMATGRIACLPEGLGKAGVEVNGRGFIKVDSHMETTAKGIYAIGDVNGLSMLAHSASAQGRVVASGDPGAFDDGAVPSVVFTSPEFASVGMTQTALDSAGVEYSVIKRQYASNGKACADGDTDGIVKILTDKAGVILGVSILGNHASELIAQATIHMKNRTPVDRIARQYIIAHPTLPEIFT